MPKGSTPLLEACGLTKAYDGTIVLSAVDIHIARGEIVGLIGENGAGKSTLLNILSGVVAPDAGSISRAGVPLIPAGYKESVRNGVLRVFQQPALVDNLRVYENVFLAWENHFCGAFGLLNRTEMRTAARRALDEAGLHAIRTDRKVSTLSPSERQSLDIARVGAMINLLQLRDPVILFDEPTSALDKTNESYFLDYLKRLRGHASVVFISHRLTEILDTCDRVIVLKDGAKVADRPREGLIESDLHRLMVGRERELNYYLEDRQARGSGVKVLEAERLGLRAAFESLSFSVCEGEIVGIAGTDGSGKRRLGKTVAGDLSATSGTLRLRGRPVPAGVPGAVSSGIVYISGDRQNEGLIGFESILGNFQLPSLHDLFSSALGLWDRAKAIRFAKQYMAALEVTASNGVKSRIGTLSGGNQQKVLLAKWLVRRPAILVLENPTQGVDTGARQAIYSAVRDAAEAGAGVLLISDDLPELIGISDRILVLVEGTLAASFGPPPVAKPTEAEVVAVMIPAARTMSGGRQHV
jgi:ribose transport system ATP-binding protein